MPRSLVEFIERVEDGSINLTPQQLTDLIDLINNANIGPPPHRARNLQQALMDQFDVDVLLRDCQLMISLRDVGRLAMATTPPANDLPEAKMTY